MKNAIDWASRPYGDSAWNGKPATIMGASIGAIATARAQYDLRKMMVFLNMFPINQPEVVIGNAAERFDKQGNLTDGTTRNFIRQLLQNLLDWTRRISEPQKIKQKQIDLRRSNAEGLQVDNPGREKRKYFMNDLF